MSKKIQAVIFDLDGVITDTAEYHYLAWKELAARLGISIDREFNEQLKGVSRTDSLEKILMHGGKEKEFTEEEKAELAASKNDHYKTLIEQITPDDILPGIRELLQNLKEEQIKIGLASASKNAPVILERLQLASRFDAVADAGAVKKGKPDPEIFLTAAALLEAEPRHCIGIEDALAGVEAIKSAGMFAVGVGPQDILKEADMVVSYTSELSFTDILANYQQSGSMV